MAEVKCGAELVKLLRQSGTPAGPDGPLLAARECLSSVHAAKKRTATANEVIAALEATLTPEHGTVKKAKVIAATGTWDAPAPVVPPIEEQLAGPMPEKSDDAPGFGTEKIEGDGKPDPKKAKVGAK